MKYAILGDVHANQEALESVLDDAQSQGVTHYACTGDVVGYNADPKNCLKLIRSLKCKVVQGNHDYYAGCNESMDLFTPMAQKSIYWTRRNLSMLDRKFLRDLPKVSDIESFTIVHSSLNNPDRWNYIFKRIGAEASFRNQFSNVCFFGHTHVPLAFVSDGIEIDKGFYETIQVKEGFKYLINVGSVGQPRDRNPLAAYAIYDLEQQTITLRRVEYDIAAVQKKIRDAGLPFRNALRLERGR
ncbi:MAG: metallophosphoesterase family protein [Pontiellaceae bacterium]|nr:metallophosphoesterase family protein [Pontiellaceae bacterium]MBN2785535.1 metallophosphoesterase family protein [Pontiellaceae bacterium]